MASPSGWIPNTLGTVELQTSGVVVPTLRPSLNFAGATFEDDGDRITVSFAASGGSGDDYDEKAVAWLEDPTFDHLQEAVTGQDLATTATEQTFTTKTIDADTNVITVASGAAGDLLVHNGTKFVRLAKGAALEALRVNAGETGLEWAALAGASTPTGTGLVTVTDGDQDTEAKELGTGVSAWLEDPKAPVQLGALRGSVVTTTLTSTQNAYDPGDALIVYCMGASTIDFGGIVPKGDGQLLILVCGDGGGYVNLVHEAAGANAERRYYDVSASDYLFSSSAILVYVAACVGGGGTPGRWRRATDT